MNEAAYRTKQMLNAKCDADEHPRLKINKNRNSENCEKSDDLSEKRHCDVSKAYQYIEKKF